MIFTAYILDVFTNFIYPAEIIVENGLIKDVTPIVTNMEYETDLEGILLPGFIDSHIHIESTMLTPSEFAKVALSHGTTSVIADPHEIANVAGEEGIDFMIENSKLVPFDFYFTAPSCVPATFFETSGAVLNSDSICSILKKDEVVALGEMMNFPAVISCEEEVIKKLEMAKLLDKVIDGHAPLLSGRDLEKYVFWNISTDHECSNFDEAIEKKKLGMKIMVREGSSAKNMESLFDYSDRINYWRNHESFGKLTSYEFEKNLTSPLFDFLVSDDKDPKDLLKGHLNSLIKKAESFDIDIIEAIKMVTINPANHYKLNAGAIINGRKANFVLIDNLKDFNIKKTFVNGEVVYDGCNVLFDSPRVKFKNTFNLNKKEASDFDIILNNRDKVIVRLIRCFNGDLITEESEAILNVENNIIETDINNDILKIAVVERYGGNTISNAFIKGFNLKKGAIASSIAHDSHNIVVVGTNSEDMAKAVNIIIENKGGLSIVSKDFEKSLALPIGGLMSDKSAEEVAKDLEELHEIANDFGSKLDSPFMTLSFMSLLVIPKLKLSNKGLFSVDLFSFVDLVKD